MGWTRPIACVSNIQRRYNRAPRWEMLAIRETKRPANDRSICSSGVSFRPGARYRPRPINVVADYVPSRCSERADQKDTIALKGYAGHLASEQSVDRHAAACGCRLSWGEQPPTPHLRLRWAGRARRKWWAGSAGGASTAVQVSAVPSRSLILASSAAASARRRSRPRTAHRLRRSPLHTTGDVGGMIRAIDGIHAARLGLLAN